MARVYRQAEARRLALPGRLALEIVGRETGARAVTLRLVEIPVPRPGEAQRPAHRHRDFEECIFVLSGRGTTFADSGEHRLEPGDTLWVPAGERHVTRNTGDQPLVLLSFFPVADIREGTEEPALGGAARS